MPRFSKLAARTAFLTRMPTGALLTNAVIWPTGTAQAQTKIEWVATTAAAAWVTQAGGQFAPGSAPAELSAEINVTQPWQTIEGFGACFNELG